MKRVAFATFGLLLIPLLAMVFTDSVNWEINDFIVMGVMLFTAGMLIELALKKFSTYRMVAVGVVVLAFLWLWAELAVGVFTNWGS
ncbi:MAG TPA: hypothetical protein VFS75_03705 [Candidatus Paceibacterota bacterium]|nr:hypothetical protein [Candidatus Paceibacterota bacterium]